MKTRSGLPGLLPSRQKSRPDLKGRLSGRLFLLWGPMSKTREQLRNKAYDILVGGDAGQTPSSEDADAIDGYIDPVIAKLAAKSSVYIQDADAVEDELFIDLAKLVANAAQDEFGGVIDPNKDLYHTNQLRVLTRQTPGYGPQQVDYF